MIFFDNYQFVFQLFLAGLLGGLIGLEREHKGKEAGLQTYSLVALGSCLFTVIALLLAESNIVDPSPIIIAIAVGMGFIGAGAIFRGDNTVKGLTTAAGLWVTAAMGMAVGSQFYLLAVWTTFLILIIFFGLGLLEEKFFRKEKQ
ncbi:MAG: MgtC/SapB family protein [Candidatus Pacebacteria bacterium]|nr:MgtC/SapB family protein [Candidatus Paceibacterota bacterium]